METLPSEQSEIGRKIEDLLQAFNTETPQRVTRGNLEYLNKVSDQLESLWIRFTNNNEKLIKIKQSNSDHLYFKNNYYKEIEGVYNDLKEKLKEANLKLSVPNTSKLSEDDRDNTVFNLTITDENQDVMKLVKKQRSAMSTLVHYIRDIESKAHQTHSRPYYELKLKLLQTNWADITQNNQVIWESASSEEPCGYKTEFYFEVDDWVQDTIISLQQQLRNLQDSASSQPQNTSDLGTAIKLPKITLPNFDGNYLRWTQFHDLYIQLIHNYPISNAQKMFYLVSNLTGEAKALIHHLPISDGNYETAWNILKNRYSNKRLLVTALINKFLAQPTIQTEGAAAIKALHDNTNECILALKNFGISIESWDPLLIHILIKKLDKNTHTLYEQSLESPRELQTIKHFLLFLESRFQALEALGRDKRHAIQERSSHSSKSSSFVSTINGRQCVVCKQKHPLYLCKEFLSHAPATRYQILKRNHLCINCMKDGHSAIKCSMRNCLKCSKKHNTLVHIEESSKSSHTPGRIISSTEQLQLQPRQSIAEKRTADMSGSTNNNAEGINSTILAAQTAQNQRGYVLLSTVIIKLRNNEGNNVECKAILDSGSQLNFITERLVKKLGLKGTPDSMSIQGIGEGKQQSNYRVNLVLQSRLTEFSTRVEAFILPKITSYQPTYSLNTDSWPIPGNIELADPNFSRPSQIDFLIGAEFYHQLLSTGQIKLGDDLPTLQNTVFGWVFAGRIQGTNQPQATCGICHEGDLTLDDKIERFWKLEEIESHRPSLTAAEVKCESHFSQTTKRDSSGRFVVKLPFLHHPSKLGESRDIALQRFLSLERKFSKNPEIKEQYVAFMKEYLQLEHMEEVNPDNITKPYYYLPHHCVIKPDSTTTKLRVVFDGSTKSSSNIALNELLSTGPRLQDDLFSILLRFRMPRFVFTADIEKMYRQVLMHENDRKYQMILWRDNPNEAIKSYQLKTVTYGTTSAPYLAIKCLQQLSVQGADQFPLGSRILKRDFYVDDIMTGSNSLVEALEMQEQLTKLLKSAGFNLRKWCANHTKLLQNIHRDDVGLQLELYDEEEGQIKTLGLMWLPKADEFRIKTVWPEGTKVTKRTVLSDTAHLFDPLGVMSPVIVTAKIFLQRLWRIKLDWDTSLPTELQSAWLKFREGLKVLNDIKIPRHIFSGRIPQSTQLHAFSDASEKAYGTAVYVRSRRQDGTIAVQLLCAKSKVAPNKTTTLPRLELCAAKLAAQLVQRITTDLNWHDQPCFFWTDSEIVLAWLNSESSSYHTFVANRVAAIQELTAINQWRHVPSKENPADLVSRGVPPERLSNCNLWFYGPIFLHGSEDVWPTKNTITDIDLERKQSKIILAATEEPTHFVHTINHHNSFKRLQRVVAYVLRFIANIRQHTSIKGKIELTVAELEDALTVIIKETQAQGFSEDLKQLQRINHVNNNSALSSLSPFIDERGIIRVGGRLEASNLPYDAKHPMLLPYSHDITRLLMTHLHITNLHVGAQTLLSITRQRFWPIKGKTTARSIVQNCLRCARSKPKMLSQFMGNLPPHRVQPARPFINSGVDFCGPFWTHFKVRGKRPHKSYIAVFCCFATKATHFEVVSDLTTDAFIGALKRFISRRGNCRNLYCDNATNFVGARNQLIELKDTICSDNSHNKISTFCSTKGVDFHFIPPRAPHFGGLWEAAVKSAKHLLQRSLASVSLTYEELETVIVEIEAILNSRPLTPFSTDPNDLTALTPGHFLIGEPLTSTVDPQAQSLQTSLLQRWKLVSHLKNQFWERWSKEYLHELQHRYKWKQRCDNAQAGMMVLIKEDNLPVLKWPLGRIIQTIKGKDGLIRVADVKTTSGILRRPIHKLAPLPIVQDQESLNGPGDAELNSQRGKTDASKKERLIKHKTNQNQTSDTTNEEKSTSREQDHSPSTSKKLRYTSSLSSVLFLSCLIMPVLSNPDVEVSPFQSQPGLYFEGMGPTHLVSNEWNLVIFYNMTTYWKEFESITSGIVKLEKLCKTMKDNSTCTLTVSQFFDLLATIQFNNELLQHQNNPRVKRAPLDVIGNLANTLFGVLDSKYAEKMAQTIENLKDNDDHLLELLKNQTSIIDSTASVMRKSYKVIEGELRNIDTYINLTIAHLNQLHQELHEQKSMETFNAASVRLLLVITNYQRIQSILLDVLVDTHHGKINPQLLVPRQLETELTRIKEHLPSTLRLPAKQDHPLELYSLMTIEGRVLPAHLIFRLKLPLFAYEQFEMLRVVPVPILVNETFITIKPSSDYLIINLHRDQYYPLSEQEMSSCTIIGDSTHMCKQHHPLHRKGSNVSSCELSYLSHSSSSASCQFMKLTETPRWIQLLSSNHWIYVMKKPTIVNVVCGTKVSQQTLEGSGILKLANDCAIKEEFFTIQAHNIYASTMTTSFVSSRNFTELLHSSKIAKILYQAPSHEDIATDIQEIQNRIQQLKKEEQQPLQTHDAHQFVIGYLGLLFIIAILGYLTWKHQAHRWCPGKEPSAPIPTPRSTSLNQFKLRTQPAS